MVSSKAQNATGYGFLGFAAGLLLFCLFYIATLRQRISERESWTWVGIFLATLLGPTILAAAYGATRRETSME